MAVEDEKHAQPTENNGLPPLMKIRARQCHTESSQTEYQACELARLPMAERHSKVNKSVTPTRPDHFNSVPPRYAKGCDRDLVMQMMINRT